MVDKGFNVPFNGKIPLRITGCKGEASSEDHYLKAAVHFYILFTTRKHYAGAGIMKRSKLFFKTYLC